MHYYGETSELHIYNYSNQSYTLLWHKLKEYSVYPYNRSVIEPNYHSKCSMASFVFHQHPAWSDLRQSSVVNIASAVHNALRVTIKPFQVSIERCLEQASDTHDPASRPIFDSQLE